MKMVPQMKGNRSVICNSIKQESHVIKLQGFSHLQGKGGLRKHILFSTLKNLANRKG